MFDGAWLTDIDDTLLPSGEKPDDTWVESLANFITILKQHNILWAPVSGVALEKMGPRLLFRLPENVLSHVVYYGGEGSTKSIFDDKTKSWRSVSSFEQYFSDTQALALIGKERLLTTWQQDEKRINTAQKELDSAEFHKGNLIDQMEDLLEANSFDSKNAETYYRGGALSWMMLGDKSVQLYKDEKASSVRYQIRDFAKNWVEKNNYLLQLGDVGVDMPYLHSTRGIKLVLRGNDKGRAADDLIYHYNIPAKKILFVGNELFNGGNDNSVRRVAGINILSVGEKEDEGVINGGVQTTANQYWMNWVSGKNLSSGKSWDEALKDLPDQAQKVSLTQRIKDERKHKSDFSKFHKLASPCLPAKKLATIILRHLPAMQETRAALVRLRELEYTLLAWLAVLPDYHYDEARKLVCLLVKENQQADKDKNGSSMAEKIKSLLLSELKEVIRRTYIDQYDIPARHVESCLDNATQVSDLLPELETLFHAFPSLEFETEKDRATTLVENWSHRIDHFTNDWFVALKNWKDKKNKEMQGLFHEKKLIKLNKTLSEGDIYYYLRRLVPRLFNFPHLKDLDKPTIILVAGTSGVGKSTISQYISKTMGISTHFSTDVTSRSVLRKSFKYFLGNRATELFPELYGSSFDQDNLSWFYTQSLLGMTGTSGSIDRLVKENVSAVIDGVSLIPGMLEERYFEIANIVWVVVCIDDKDTHHQRLGTRSETGVSRGGADRYRQKIRVIRNNHDRLVLMGKKSGSFILDNSTDLHNTIYTVIEHIKSPFSDRRIHVVDEYLEEAENLLIERMEIMVQGVRSGYRN